MQSPFTILSITNIINVWISQQSSKMSSDIYIEHVIISDAILLDGGTTINVFNYRAFSSVVPRTWNIITYDLRKIQS